MNHDPERIAALVNLSSSANGHELQQFLCGLGSMRSSIPGYDRLVSTLTDAMERACKVARGRKSSQVKRVNMDEIDWTEKEELCLELAKKALSQLVELSHMDITMQLLVFTDASDRHWGAVIRQVDKENITKRLDDHDHQPFMFSSGTFSGSPIKWAVGEEEA